MNMPKPNEIVTIVVKHGAMKVVTGQEKGSRLVWRASGLDVFVKGSISKGNDFEIAVNLALHECYNRHIPLISLRYQKGCKCNEQTSGYPARKSRKTDDSEEVQNLPHQARLFDSI